MHAGNDENFDGRDFSCVSALGYYSYSVRLSGFEE